MPRKALFVHLGTLWNSVIYGRTLEIHKSNSKGPKTKIVMQTIGYRASIKNAHKDRSKHPGWVLLNIDDQQEVIPSVILQEKNNCKLHV